MTDRPMPTSMAEPLLRVRALVKTFATRRGLLRSRIGLVRAVDHVSFDVCAGETLGVVGESGCGKSTTGRCILRLIEPDAGEVWFDGKNVVALDQIALRALSRAVPSGKCRFAAPNGRS